MRWASLWRPSVQPGGATALHTMNAKCALTDRRNYMPIRTAAAVFSIPLMQYFPSGTALGLSTLQVVYPCAHKGTKYIVVFCDQRESCLHSNWRPINSDSESNPRLSWEIISDNQEWKETRLVLPVKKHRAKGFGAYWKLKGKRADYSNVTDQTHCPTHQPLATGSCPH